MTCLCNSMYDCVCADFDRAGRTELWIGFVRMVHLYDLLIATGTVMDTS